jgi:UDP-galactopyranose mutase
MTKALVIGAGVSGCTSAYCLKQKGYEVTVMEKTNRVGGLSHTNFYHGHPYEFGPHVWFWPKERENKLIYDLCEDGMYEVDRKLFSYTEDGLYRYPIHYDDIQDMPNADMIKQQLVYNRDFSNKLNYGAIPKIGECKFSEYFRAAIGSVLYDKFMKEYTYKMWGISGDELETNMVWADRMKTQDKIFEYDPIKWENHSLGKGLANWYPKSKRGWNVVWENMVKDCNVIFGKKVDNTYNFSQYDIIICTMSPDAFCKEDALPYNGRLIVPLLVPGNAQVYPKGTESIHYADNSPATRTTEMKAITRYESSDSLLLIEIPIDGTKESAFPQNIMIPEHFCKHCYARQTPEAIKQYEEYIIRINTTHPNIIFAGRHGMFKYWGMPEVVQNAIETIDNL